MAQSAGAAWKAVVLWLLLAVGVLAIALGTFAGNGSALAQLAFAGDVICSLAAFVAGVVAVLRLRSLTARLALTLGVGGFAALDVIVTLIAGGVASGDFRG